MEQEIYEKIAVWASEGIEIKKIKHREVMLEKI